MQITNKTFIGTATKALKEKKILFYLKPWKISKIKTKNLDETSFSFNLQLISWKIKKRNDLCGWTPVLEDAEKKQRQKLFHCKLIVVKFLYAYGKD